MSHYASIRTTITDEAALLDALRALGLKPEVHGRAVRTATRWNNGSPAHIIVPGTQLKCDADLGFRRPEKTGEPFVWLADDYEIRRSNHPEIRRDLNVEYQTAVAARAGYEVIGREKLPDGRMQLRLSAPAARVRR